MQLGVIYQFRLCPSLTSFTLIDTSIILLIADMIDERSNSSKIFHMIKYELSSLSHFRSELPFPSNISFILSE